MSFLSTSLMRRAVQQHGIVTAHQLHDDGLDHHDVIQLLRRDALVRTQRGVFRISSIPDSFEARCAAACAADPAVVVAGVSAARLWGFRHVFHPHTPELMSERRSSPLTGVTRRHTNSLVNEDMIERPDAIRIASPARAWFDCAPHFDDDRFEMITDAVLNDHCQAPTLWQTLRRLDSRGRLGLARVRRVLSRRAEWQRPNHLLEHQLIGALRSSGVAGLHAEHTVSPASNIHRHIVACDPAMRWGVEVEHLQWHGGRFSLAQHEAQQRASATLGWTIEVVTDVDVQRDLTAVAERLAESYGTHTTCAA